MYLSSNWLTVLGGCHSVKLEEVSWDSQHFGIKVGKLMLDQGTRSGEVRSLIQERSYDCIISRVAGDELEKIHVLEENGFRLMDIQAVLRLELEGDTVSPPITFEIVPCTPDDLDTVTKIARNAFGSDHFHVDRRFDSERVDEMYEKWVRKCFAEKYDMTLAKMDGAIAGFHAAKVEGASAYIELVAVTENYRGRGVAKALVLDFLRRVGRKARVVDVRTQITNLPAIRLYEGLGFKMVSSLLTFHWWRGEKAP